MKREGFTLIPLIVLVAIVLGICGAWYYLSHSSIASQTLKNTNQSSTVSSASSTNDWTSYINRGFGFNFRYPSNWKIEDNLTKNSCCLNILNTLENPYFGPGLKAGIMNAQASIYSGGQVSSKTQFLNKIVITGKNSAVTDIPNQNGLDILKINGNSYNAGEGEAIADYYYFVPLKKDFSQVIFIAVWQPDGMLEGVLRTLNI